MNIYVPSMLAKGVKQTNTTKQQQWLRIDTYI